MRVLHIDSGMFFESLIIDMFHSYMKTQANNKYSSEGPFR